MNPCRPAPLPLAALLLAAGLCGHASAETNPWYVGVAQAFSYDSNLYRVDDSVTLAPGLSRSDTISTTSLVGGLDQPIGRQHLYGDVSLRNNRYKNNDYLNDTGYGLTAALDWSTVERFSGTFSLAASQNQKRFNVDSAPGVVETQKNLENIEQFDAKLRAGLVTRLSLDTGFSQRRVDYSAPQWAASQYRQDRFWLGLSYRPGIATFGVAPSRWQTDYAVSNETVHRDALDLWVNWPASGASNVYFRISPTRVTYNTFTERDFSGPTGALKWDWRPADRLTVVTKLVHDIGQDTSFETFGGPVVIGTNDLARTTTDLRLTADYQATAKIALNAVFGKVYRTLARRISGEGEALTIATGSDDETLFTLGAVWTPIRSVQLGCSAGIDRRTAEGGLTQAYKANIANCYGQFTLQ